MISVLLVSAAHIPSRLKPSGLAQADGKCPDGITLAPWKCGQLLVWDATCPDTYAPSYASIAVAEAGAEVNLKLSFINIVLNFGVP